MSLRVGTFFCFPFFRTHSCRHLARKGDPASLENFVDSWAKRARNTPYWGSTRALVFTFFSKALASQVKSWACQARCFCAISQLTAHAHGPSSLARVARALLTIRHLRISPRMSFLIIASKSIQLGFSGNSTGSPIDINWDSWQDPKLIKAISSVPLDLAVPQDWAHMIQLYSLQL